MTLLNYSQNQFFNDLNSLQFSKPNNIILELNPYFNERTVFFGGREWSNFSQDINHVSDTNKAFFCICLFSMVSADQNMYAHFPNLIDRWSRQFQYPKFGWCGFGEHFEKVKYLLQIPEQNGVDFDGISDTEIQEYFRAHYQNGRIILGVFVQHFFNIMLEDVDFNFESNIFSRFRRIMIDSINENKCV